VKFYEQIEYLSCLKQLKTLQMRQICTKHAEHSICHHKILNDNTTWLLPPPQMCKLGGRASLPMGRLTPVYTQLHSNNFINIIISELVLV
jgi:hypothetical protein